MAEERAADDPQQAKAWAAAASAYARIAGVRLTTPEQIQAEDDRSDPYNLGRVHQGPDMNPFLMSVLTHTLLNVAGQDEITIQGDDARQLSQAGNHHIIMSADGSITITR